jgi:hypothetical protein
MQWQPFTDQLTGIDHSLFVSQGKILRYISLSYDYNAIHKKKSFRQDSFLFED